MKQIKYFSILLIFLLLGCSDDLTTVQEYLAENDVKSIIGIAIDEGNDIELRETAINALGVVKDPYALEALTRLLKQDENYIIRCASAEALRFYTDPRAISALSDSLNDKYELVRLYAADSLTDIATESSLKILVKQKDKEKSPIVKLWIEQNIASLTQKKKDSKKVKLELKTKEESSSTMDDVFGDTLKRATDLNPDFKDNLIKKKKKKTQSSKDKDKKKSNIKKK